MPKKRFASAVSGFTGWPDGETKVRLAETAPRKRRPRKRHLIFLHLIVEETGIRINTAGRNEFC